MNENTFETLSRVEICIQQMSCVSKLYPVRKFILHFKMKLLVSNLKYCTFAVKLLSVPDKIYLSTKHPPSSYFLPYILSFLSLHSSHSFSFVGHSVLQ